MDMSENPTLTLALDLWADWFKNNFTEVRQLWYPSQTPGMVGGWTRGEHAWEDMEDDCNAVTITATNTAIKDLPDNLQSALKWSLDVIGINGYAHAVINILPPAHRACAERMLGLQACVKTSRIDQEQLIGYLTSMAEQDAAEARKIVWRKILIQGAVSA